MDIPPSICGYDGVQRLVVYPTQTLIEWGIVKNNEVIETGKCVNFQEVREVQQARGIASVVVDDECRAQESNEAAFHYAWKTYHTGPSAEHDDKLLVSVETTQQGGSRTVETPSFRRHDLKTWPTYFAASLRGDKPFEIRKNDRDYQVMDWLCLHEWDPEESQYTGRLLVREVTYVLRGPVFGIDKDFCVMSTRTL